MNTETLVIVAALAASLLLLVGWLAGRARGVTEQKLREMVQASTDEAFRKSIEPLIQLNKSELGKSQQAAASDLEKRHTAIDAIVKPIQEALSKLDGKTAELEKNRIESHSSLVQQIQTMISSEKELREETSRLTNALRQPQVRGRWGEIQLRRVVEMAGMLEHCDFEEQESIETEEGRLRPDLIVKLPGGGQIVVDSKVPLSAYLDSLETDDQARRDALLADYARQVRDRVKELAGKKYWAQYTQAPDFVCLFLPGEALFFTALKQDRSFLESSIEQKVLPTSPINLVALLRVIAYGWRQEKLAKNAEEIRKLGSELYDRIRTMTGHFQKMGGALDGAVSAFNAAVASLETRALPAARRFRELGATSTEDIPEVKVIESVPRKITSPELLGEDSETTLKNT